MLRDNLLWHQWYRIFNTIGILAHTTINKECLKVCGSRVVLFYIILTANYLNTLTKNWQFHKEVGDVLSNEILWKTRDFQNWPHLVKHKKCNYSWRIHLIRDYICFVWKRFFVYFSVSAALSKENLFRVRPQILFVMD